MPPLPFGRAACSRIPGRRIHGPRILGPRILGPRILGPRSLRTLLPVAVVLLAVGHPPPRADAAPEEAPAAEVFLVDGSAVRGRLEAVGPEAIRLLEGTTPRTWTPAEVREVRWPIATRPAAPTPTLRVALTAGDVLYGTYGGPTQDGLAIETPAAGRLALPFEAVRSIEALPPDAATCFDAAATHPAGTEGDRVYLRSGDAYTGVITQATAQGLEIETARGATRAVAWSDLLVVHVQGEPADTAEPADAAPYAEVATADGSVFVSKGYPTGGAASLTFALRAAPGTTVKVSGEKVRSLRTHSTRFAYASELPWTGKFEPYYGDTDHGDTDHGDTDHGDTDPEGGASSLLARWFAPRADRRPSGCPLRVAGEEHRRGFGVHSRTTIRVTLGGAWTTFETGIGIDDEALAEGAALEAGAPRGDVDVRILGDDRVLWEAKGVKGGEAARAVGPLDVQGVRVLVLEVDFGAGMHARDHADWLSPLLTRPAAAAPK